MAQETNIWEIAEAYNDGTLSPSDLVKLKDRLADDAAFAKEFEGSLAMVRGLNDMHEHAAFKDTLQQIHAEREPVKNTMRKIMALPREFWRTGAVAATVAVLTSTITFWSLNPSIKKNDSQYNTISREVEHIKKGLKSNTDEIENIKKTTTPVPSSTEVRYTGTGFAITNDGYFVTAWHVVNQGNFDSVYILTSNNEYFKASLIRHDDKADIALLKVDKKNFKFSKTDIPYTIAATKAPIGTGIFTLGYPKDDEVYSEGYISSRNGYEDNDLQYTLELPAAHGQSGSPVMNAAGEVIGMLTAVGSQGEGNTYAVSSRALVALVEDTPNLGKTFGHHVNKLHKLPREQQIAKMEACTFSVKVFKK
jgi:serine protease Do